ncbi:MAG TPA: fibronectin type III domain-containing protein [Candidatus Limnocylindrales bacterium]|jgi:phosphodiesterase/alkaline phosphatase D-like protein|nr:fibronectin type III domain-containing protein [Candidatus Limnocylindrales bacterium]
MKFLFVLVATLLLCLCIGVAQTPAAPAANQAANPPEVTHGPVLEYVTDHDAVIAWTTKQPYDMQIHYGTSPTSLTQASEVRENGKGTNHRVQLNNLQPSTTYYIQMTNNTGGAIGSVVQFQTTAKGAAPQRQNVDLGK